MFFVLQRVSLKHDGSFGNLLDNNFYPIFNTIERPWNNNKPCTCKSNPCTCDSSCIPPGIYRCRKIKTRTGRKTYEILNVPDRTEILFDVANTYLDLKGCVGMGKSWGVVNGIHGVHSSKKAMSEFMTSIKKINEFILFLVNPSKKTQSPPNYLKSSY